METTQTDAFYVIYDGAHIEIREGTYMFSARVNNKIIGAYKTWNAAFDAACDYAELKNR